MAALPDDIWRSIVKYLPFKDLENFKLSHRHAGEISGEAWKSKPWETIFVSFEWVKTANINRRIPFLLFTDEDMDKPYVYLYLATKKASGENRVGPTEVRQGLFNEIKASLHPTTPRKQDCEVELKELTLNISHVRHEDFIICENLVQRFHKKPHTLVPYGKKPRTIKLRTR
jgi:hypothetical protein